MDPTRKKTFVRFDPEDEIESTYIKNGDVPMKMQTKKEKKNISRKKAKVDIPVSSERYIDVANNLKNILESSSKPFSLAAKFSTNEKEIKEDIETDEEIAERNDSSQSLHGKNRSSEEPKPKVFKNRSSEDSKEEGKKKFTFFISEKDPCLKEAVEWFQVSKSALEDIHRDWEKTKEEVRMAFKIQKRMAKRSSTSKLKEDPKKSRKRKEFERQKERENIEKLKNI